MEVRDAIPCTFPILLPHQVMRSQYRERLRDLGKSGLIPQPTAIDKHTLKCAGIGQNLKTLLDTRMLLITGVFVLLRQPSLKSRQR